jgi:Ca2+-binding RTX toxin-like protein
MTCELQSGPQTALGFAADLLSAAAVLVPGSNIVRGLNDGFGTGNLINAGADLNPPPINQVGAAIEATAQGLFVAGVVVGLAAAAVTAAAPGVALAVALGVAFEVITAAAAITAGASIGQRAAELALGCPEPDPRNDPNYDPDNQPVSPLIIDLDGNGVQTTSLNTSLTFFDLNADGFSERTAWASATDGLLALDRNGNGSIDNITELFGTVTSNGFTILSQLDENQDGEITETDAAFADLRVWRDANGDGESTADELLSLTELGITSIDAVGTALPAGTTNNGNTVSHTGNVTFADGHTASIDDVWFEHTDTVTRVNTSGNFVHSDEALQLPDVEGMGLIADLQYAMTLDLALAQMVKQLVLDAPTMSGEAFRSAFEAIALKWAGVDDISPTSRGGFIDARHLAFVEKAFVDSYVQQAGLYAGTSDAGFNASYGLELKFDELVNKFMSDFAVQVMPSTVNIAGQDFNQMSSAFNGLYGALTFFSYDEDQAEVLDFGPEYMGDIILAFMPEELPDAIRYLDQVSTALAGFTPEEGTREAWARLAFSGIESTPLQEYAVQRFLSGTSPIGTEAAEQLIILDPDARSWWNTNARAFSSAIWSGEGDDTVGAGAGSDTYLFLKGDGSDTIIDDAFQGAGGNVAEALPDADDRLIFADRNVEDAVFTADGFDLVVTFNDGTSDNIRITDYFATRTTELPSEYLIGNVLYTGIDAFLNPVSGNVGRIEIFQFMDRELSFAEVINIIREQQQTFGNDTIVGFETDETIVGGQGNDLALGGEGSDTYVFLKGDGNDTYVELSYPDSADRFKFTTDTVHFADSILSELSFSRTSGALVISFDDASYGQVSINDQPLLSNSGLGIEYISFADGSKLSLFQAQILSGLAPPASAVLGQANAEPNGLVAEQNSFLDFPTSLKFFYISSVFYGEDVELTFKGGFGDDTYVFNSTNSHITIDDSGVPLAFYRPEPQGRAQDVLWLQDIALADLSFERGGDRGYDLVILHNGIEIVRVQNEFDGNLWRGAVGINDGVEVIVDEGLQTLNRYDLANLTVNVGTSGDDYMQGVSQILGYDESGNISEFYAHDQHRGGLGNDQIVDVNGSDRYYYASGDGDDVIIDFNSNSFGYDGSNDSDTLYLLNLNQDQVRFEIADYPVVSSDYGGISYFREIFVRDLTTGNTIRIEGNLYEYGAGLKGIEKIVFADGTELNRQQISDSAIFYGTFGDDEITEVQGKVQAGTGDDYVIGWRPTDYNGYYGLTDQSFGENTLLYSLGDGNDQIENVDVLKFSNVNSQDVSITRSGFDLAIVVNATGEKIIEENYFLNDANFTSSDLYLTFSDGLGATIQPPTVNELYYDAGLSEVEALPSWLEFDGNTGHFTGTAPNGLSGAISVIVYAYDFDDIFEGVKNISIDIVAGEVDYFIPEDLFLEPTSNAVVVTATLEDGSPLPNWLQFDTATNSFFGVAPSLDQLPVEVVLTVTVSGLSSINYYSLDPSGRTYDQFSDGPDLSRIEFADGVILTQEQIFASATSQGSIADDVIAGSVDDEIILGLSGNDTISGGGGNDELIGGLGFDSLSGGAGDDRFEASQGDTDQSVDGGEGVDILDLSRVTSGVTVDLATGQVIGAGYSVGVLSSIETVIGSRGNDTILGSAGNDTLQGYQGNDIINGDAGDDLISGGIGADNLNGGDGFDTLSYIDAKSGVTVNLSTAVGTGGEASGDLLNNFEAVLGSNYNDNITGSVYEDNIALNAGNDKASGLAGDDIIDGGSGNDEIDGGEGIDWLLGGAGNDILAGGQDDDKLEGGLGNDQLVDDQGSEVFVWSLGDGSDVIQSRFSTTGDETSVDTLVLHGVTPSQLTLVGFRSELTIKLPNNTSIKISNQFADDITANGIEQIVFDDGTIWDRIQIEAVTSFLANRAPVTLSDTISVFSGQAFTVTSESLTENDLDLEGDAFVITSVSNASHGTVTLNGGNVTFTAVNGFVGEGSFDYTVTDTLGATTVQTVKVQIGASLNSAPVVASPLADRMFNEDEAVVVTVPTGTFTDVDGDTLTFTMKLSCGCTLPSWLVIDSATGAIIGTPPANFSGSFGLMIIASDGTLSATDEFVLIVAAVNDAPVLSAVISNASSGEDAFVSIALPQNLFFDVDNLQLALSATLADGSALPAWLSFDAATGGFSGTPPLNFNGNVDVKVSASDGELEASGTFTLAITPINDAPLLSNALADVASLEDQQVNFTLPADAFSDVDGDDLVMSAKLATGEALPSWLAFNAVAGSFSGTPPANFNGTISVVVTASDGEMSVSDSFDINITSVNDAPIVAVSPSNQTSLEDQSFNILMPEGTFTDVDGDTLTYSANMADGSGLPAWLTINTATGALSGTPPLNFNGVLDIELTASESSAAVSDVFSLTVTAVNDAPVVNVMIPDTSSQEDQAVNFAIPANTFFDVDGNTLTLTATLSNGDALPSWLSFNGTTGAFTGIPPLNLNGSLVVKVTASDGELATFDNFTLVITAVNDAPVVAQLLGDVASPEDTVVNFSLPANAFSDVDNSSLTYSATLASGAALPAWLSFNAATQSFSGIPPLNFSGSIDVMVSASDGSLSASNVFSLVNTPVNDSPIIATLLPDRSFAEDTALSFTVPVGSFNDVDNAALTYSATLANGSDLPSWLTFNAGTQAFSGTPPLNFNGTIDVKVTASDGALSASDEFALTITPVNDAPIVAQLLADVSAAEDTAISFTLPVNAFSDVDSSTLTYSAMLASGAALPTWLTFNAATRQFSGTPPLNFFGVLEVKVTASDGALVTSDVFTLNVTPVNDAPVAVNDGPLTVTFNTALTITAASLLANDSDVDSTALSIASVQSASNGSATLDTVGNIVFTPTTGYSGTASFTYTLSDGSGGTSIATVTLSVSSGSNVINGTSGSNILFGTAANDVINALAGNDLVVAGDGNDSIYAGTGSDIVEAGIGNDLIYGEAGSDILYANDGDDTAYGGDGDDIVIGANGNDNIYGDLGNDNLSGDAGNDALFGGAGADTMFGGTGNDNLSGQTGNDIMSGGLGNDSFAFAAGFGKDRITDFQAGTAVSDIIQLSLGANFDTFAEVLAATTNVQGNAVITISPADTITLVGINKTALVDNDFLFT